MNIRKKEQDGFDQILLTRTLKWPKREFILQLVRRLGNHPAVQPLWISGLAFLIIWAVTSTLGTASFLRAPDTDPIWSRILTHVIVVGFSLPIGKGEHIDWIIYLLLSTGIPILIWKLRHTPIDLPDCNCNRATTFKSVVVVFFIFACSLYWLAHYTPRLFLLSTATFLIAWRMEVKNRKSALTPPMLLVGFTLLNIAWTTGAKLSSWNLLENWTTVEFLLSFLFLWLVLQNIYRDELSRPLIASKAFLARILNLQVVLNLIAVFIIGLASLRSDYLFTLPAFHHWSYYVGPAQLVRQGGWLLWDVPSQYGFLNILTLALLPTKSVYQSLYIVNALLLFLSACFLFFVLRALQRGFANFCFALLIVLCTIFLNSGPAPILSGPHEYPSYGSFRFFWCYALMAVIAWEFLFWREHGEIPKSKKNHSIILISGCLVWLAGTFWSAESAIYCCAIWLPAYFSMIRYHCDLIHTSRFISSPRGRATLWILLPFIMLLATIIAVSLYYVVFLGHAPDWWGFFEYLIAYSISGGFGTSAIKSIEPFWILFLIWCALTTTAFFILRDARARHSWPLVTGTWFTFLVISSYFTVRSYDMALCPIGPVIFSALGLTLLILKYQQPSHWKTLVKLSLVPVFTTILMVPVTSPKATFTFLQAFGGGYQFDVSQKLPNMDASLRDLLVQAHAKPTDNFIIMGDTTLRAWPVQSKDGSQLTNLTNSWLPGISIGMLCNLKEERRKIWMSRFSTRSHASGWLVEAKDKKDANIYPSNWPSDPNWFNWFFEQVRRTHMPTKNFSNSKWQLTWYEYKVSTFAAP